MTLDIVETFSHLRGSYFRYYDTPFGLADKSPSRSGAASWTGTMASTVSPSSS